MHSKATLLDFLEPIEILNAQSGLEGIDCIYVINLKERPEKWNSIKEELSKQHLTPNRVPAINGWNIPLEKRNELLCFPLRPLRGGEIGCLLSHVSIYQDALKRKSNAVWILEDDVQFKKSPNEISALLKKLTATDPNWDILYTDYSVSGSLPCNQNPYGHTYQMLTEYVSDDLIRIHGRWGNHSMIFSQKGISKVFNHYYFNPIIWAPIDVDIHYVPGIREYSVKESITKVSTTVSDTGPSSSFCKK